MKMTKTRRFLSLMICIVLIAAMALFANGCGKEKTPETPTETQSQSQTEVRELGEGKTEFDFSVVALDGTEEKFLIHTDKTTVGEALTQLGLIEGEEGDYGLYVKTVNGIPESDGAYWMIYVNGEMAPVGISQLEVKNGEAYSLRLEKMS